ncbi:1-phosphofructokinase family hexose kinase [Frateuria aurantia]
MASILCYTLNPAFDLAISLDHLQPGTVHRAGASQLDPAGKGINVGRVLRRLGHTVRLGGLLGRDNAAPFHELFRREQMESVFVEVEGSTRINVKLAEADGRVSDLNGPGPSITAADWQHLLQATPRQLAGIDAVVVSGSLPPGVSTDDFARWLLVLVDSGLPVWMDTSGSGLHAVRQTTVTLLKPNEEELAQLLGHALPDSGDLDAAAREVVGSGWSQQVLLSLGGAGACWFEGTSMWQAIPPEVIVRNTVCAGDTLLAAALHGQLSGWSREAGLRFAVALAAECVRHVGPGDPEAADFAELLAKVRMGTPALQTSATEMPE